MKNLKLVLTGALLLTFSINIFADGAARRKNRCRGGDKKYYALGKTKGGSPNNCGNASLNGNWSCSDQSADLKIRIEQENTPCLCAGDHTNIQKKLAVRSQAFAGANAQYSYDDIYVFGCPFPNKWKGGVSSNYYISPFNFPAVNYKSSTPPSENYHQGNKLECGELFFDYRNNTITLEKFYAELEKNTPDMANDLNTIIVQVSIVTGESSTGEEIENVIYNCKVTLFNDRLFVEDASNNITIDDFKSHPIGNNGIAYKTKKKDKVINLGTDINEEMEINVSFFTDSGNLTDGTSSRFAANPEVVEEEIKEMEKTQNIVFNVNQNPIVDYLNLTIAVRDLQSPSSSEKLVIKDITGKIVKEIPVSLSKEDQNYQIEMNAIDDGIYFIFLGYKDKEYGKKIIIDKN